MIQLTWNQIRDKEFNPIMQKVLRSKMPFHSAKKILEITKLIQAEQTKSDELWTTLAGKYLEPMPDTNEQYLRIKESLSDEEKAQALKEIEEFGQTIVELSKQKISHDELVHVEITPAELLKIEGLIEAE